MDLIAHLAAQPIVQRELARLETESERAIDLSISIQQIPAPTFAEGERAVHVAREFAARGLVDVMVDALGNVYGRRPGDGRSAPLVVSAHLDTVFGPETDLTVRREDGLVYGPGIADNSTGVAGLVLLAEALNRLDVSLAGDVIFVANVCEEGMGDLRGMRAVVERLGGDARYIVLEGGVYGHLYHRAIAVRRYRVSVTAPGGHSWGAFGAPSAVHVLGRIIAGIDDLAVPQSPRTTYNVGVVEGGRSVNTIAQRASLLLDLRSEQIGALEELTRSVRDVVAAASRDERIAIKVEQVGDRPAGELPRDAPFVRLATRALELSGCSAIEFEAGSTDANIPLSLGYEAVCIGLARSGNAHRLDEYLDPAPLPRGLAQLLLLTLAAAGMPA